MPWRNALLAAALLLTVTPDALARLESETEPAAPTSDAGDSTPAPGLVLTAAALAALLGGWRRRSRRVTRG